MKKRSYKERKKPSRPSGSAPPVPLASPCAETPAKLLREFRSLGLLPLLFPALQVVRGRGRGLGVHLVLGRGRLPPLPLDLGPMRGVGVSLDFRLLRVSELPLL